MGVGVGVGLGEGVVVGDAGGLGEGEFVGDAVGDGLSDGDGLTEGEGDALAEGDGDGLAEGEGEALGPVNVTLTELLVTPNAGKLPAGDAVYRAVPAAVAPSTTSPTPSDSVVDGAPPPDIDDGLI